MYPSQQDVDEIMISDSSIDLISNESLVELEKEKTESALCVFRGHSKGSIFCGSLSRNGELAVTGSEEDEVFIWDTNTGDIIFSCPRHKNSVICVEFNHNNTYLATLDINGFIYLWQMSDYSCLWEHKKDDAIWMKWCYSTNSLLAALTNGCICMWKLPEGHCKIFRSYKYRVVVGILFPDESRFAVGYADGTIRIIDLKKNTVLFTIPPDLGHSGTVTAIDCHVNNCLLISASRNGRTVLITTQNGKITWVLQDFREERYMSKEQDYIGNYVRTAAFCKDPTSSIAATGTAHGELYIWDISKQILVHKINVVLENAINKVLWKGNTSKIFTAGMDGIVRYIDTKTSDCLKIFKEESTDILDIDISKDEKILLTVSEGAIASIFDISSLC